MACIDYGSLELILSQTDLKLTCSLAKDQEPFEGKPDKAVFFWKRDGQLVWGIKLTSEELVEVISHLEHKHMEVPPAFRDALPKFPTS